PAGLLDEHRGYLRFTRVVVERLHVDGALRRHDLAIDAAHAHFLSIGPAQHEAKAAAYFQIDLADHQRPAARSEPAPQQLGLGKRVPAHAPWRVKDSRQ